MIFSKLKSSNLYLRSLIIGAFIAFFVFMITSSLVIAITFMFLSTAIAIVSSKRTSNKRFEAMNAAWPEVIDHLITGIQSGLSINESLARDSKADGSNEGPATEIRAVLTFEPYLTTISVSPVPSTVKRPNGST